MQGVFLVAVKTTCSGFGVGGGYTVAAAVTRFAHLCSPFDKVPLGEARLYGFLPWNPNRVATAIKDFQP